MRAPGLKMDERFSAPCEVDNMAKAMSVAASDFIVAADGEPNIVATSIKTPGELLTVIWE